MPRTSPDLKISYQRRVGEQIRWVRRSQKLSQRELGRRVGQTRQAISELENGRRMPSAMTVRRIAEELCCSTDAILPRWAN